MGPRDLGTIEMIHHSCRPLARRAGRLDGSLRCVRFAHRVYRVVVVAAVFGSGLAPPPAAEDLVPWSVASRFTSDVDGEIAGRVVYSIEEIRLFVATGARISPEHERRAPAGYTELRYTPDSFLGDQWTSVGVEAGPLVFGPITHKGVYTRAVDPTAGSWSWRALTQEDGFRLETAVEEPRQLGIALSGVADRRLSPGAGAWLVEKYDGRQWRGAALTFAGLTLLGAETTRIRDPRAADIVVEEGWWYPVPPPRSRSIDHFGASWRCEVDRWSALSEAWFQAAGRSPYSSAETIALRYNADRVTVGVRASAASVGFRDAWDALPDRSRLVSIGATGRTPVWRRSPPARAADRWTWRTSWEHRAGWDEQLPGPPEQEISLRVTQLVRGSWVLRRRVSSTIRFALSEVEEWSPDGVEPRHLLATEPFVFPSRARAVDLDSTLAVRLVPWETRGYFVDLESRGRWRVEEPGELGGIGSPGWRGPIGSARRTCSLRVEAALGWDSRRLSRDYAVELSVPLGGGGRLAGELGWEDEELAASLALEWRFSGSVPD